MTSTSLTLAVVSGKGGVGKSVLAVNLAESLAAKGRRVALVDADFGQSAAPVLLNEVPAFTAADVVSGRTDLAGALHRTAEGVTLLQGAAMPDSVEDETALFAMLDDALAQLQTTHDVVLIDAPAGVGLPVRWALDRAGAGILVLVGEPTAVADAYALTKMLWAADPDFPLGVVVNYADTEEEARSIATRFAAVTGPFLGAAPDYLGWVPYAATIRRSVQQQQPAVRVEGSARMAFAALAKGVARGPAAWSEEAATF